MSGSLRHAALIPALGALAVLGAAGLSGFPLGDPCRPGGLVEGTGTSYGWRLWPPGLECHAVVPSGTDPAGRFRYADPPRVTSAGSAARFFAALAVAALVAGLVRRASPAVPAPLRLVTCATLVLACLGAGAILGPVLGVMAALGAGIPIAMVADRHLGGGRGAGIAGALAGVLALVAAGVLWALGLGFAAFAAALAVVAAVAALPWPRLPATEARAG